MNSPGTSFLGLLTKSSQSIDVTAVMVLVGVVFGMSILMAILGLPFFVLPLVAVLVKLTPFLSSAAIASSVCVGCVLIGVALNSAELSAYISFNFL